jgi:hypothetical protein
VSVDAKGYLIFWDLRESRFFNYYPQFMKVHLKPENGANLLVNNMIVFKISKERLFEQSSDNTNNDLAKFTKRYIYAKRSASLINIHSQEAKKNDQRYFFIIIIDPSIFG